MDRASSNLKECKQDCGSCRPVEIPDCSSAAGLDIVYNRSMLWGTYTPSLFCGLRTRDKEPIVANLMWHHPSRPRDIRFKVPENWHGSYSWAEHDGRTYGRQAIVDDSLGIVMNTTVVKLKQDSRT